MNRALLKEQAKIDIKGKIGILFVISLIIYGLSYLASLVLVYIPFGGIISSIIITPAFTLSMIRVYLNLTISQDPKVSDAFSGFDDFWSAFKVSFLTGLFTFLWSLLFIVPGIIKSISYSMAPYVLAENKEMPALECIEESKRITDGYKADLFVLNLSFLGWELLSILTLGIAFIWVGPYIQATYANAYRDMSGSYPVATDNKETVEMIDAIINQDINN